MSYQSLLTDRCDIYHLQEKSAVASKFGVPATDIQSTFTYPDEPDVKQQSCYFTEKSQTLIQQEPNTTIYQSYLVHFPASADIRIHDKIVWDGLTMTLQKPKKLKNHHLEVMAIRSENL
ncbi:YqbH/XkdH family protein [Bacillus sp. NPDC077027]|uniref:YqbH/XkdH family protein n=1 Tax=Bacillus sp. NPDC077027 TaxID=3390548 RepID=UPI003D08796F